MDQKLLTIAVHQIEKATIVKKLLEANGIPVILEALYKDDPLNTILIGYCVKVQEDDVVKALTLVGVNKLFSYNDKQTLTIDDGRKRVLVAVDFSKYSLEACRAAFNVAKEINAKVKILNVLPSVTLPLHMPFGNILKQPEDEGMLDKVRRQMLTLCQEIDDLIVAGDMPSINYSYSLREGIVEQEIQNFVDEYKPVILVLGAKGKDNNNTNFIGNVTADIIEITNVPVLVVPFDAPTKNVRDIQHIGFLTNVDIRDLASFDSFVKVLSLYKALRVTLIHVNYDGRTGRFNEEQLLEMQKYFHRQYPDINVGYKLLNTDNLVESLHDFIEKENIAMLSLNTRKRNILGRIFRPSMSRKLLDLNVSLLILRG